MAERKKKVEKTKLNCRKNYRESQDVRRLRKTRKLKYNTYNLSPATTGPRFAKAIEQTMPSVIETNGPGVRIV